MSESPKQQKIVITPATRQNYAPFISKSPRFKENKEPKTKLPNIHISTEEVEPCHKGTKQKIGQLKPIQYFFKSHIERFDHGKTTQTPSPVYYHIQTNTDHHSQVRRLSHAKTSPGLKSIPTIPDIRNRFGYNFEPNGHTFVNKTVQQVQKEKYLMREYQSSLTKEKINWKKHKEPKSTLRIIDLQKKVNRLVSQEIGYQQNASKQEMKMHQTKPKYNHLYSYSPVQQPKPFPILTNMYNQQKRDQKQDKFQFFNSSQPRFKSTNIPSNSVMLKPKASVRQILSNFIVNNNN